MLYTLLDGHTIMRVDMMRSESSELNLILDIGFVYVVETRNIRRMLRRKLVENPTF